MDTTPAVDIESQLKTLLSSSPKDIEALRRAGPTLLQWSLQWKHVSNNDSQLTDSVDTSLIGNRDDIAVESSDQDQLCDIERMLRDILCSARERRELFFDDAGEVIDLFLGLLSGDLRQRRLSLAEMPTTPTGWIGRRVDFAFERVRQIYEH